MAILELVRRNLPPLHSMFLSRRMLLLIALAAVPFLTIRWFSSQLPAENTKAFQFCITLCFLWQLVLLVGSVARESTERERQLQRVLAAQQQQFDFKLQSIEAVNRKYHDMKNLLLYLEKGQRDAPELRTLLQEMAPYEALVSTGNEAVDIILTEKLTQCQQEDICCVPYVDGSTLSFVAPLDLCTIFGNALDNAIESCRAIPTAENRHISIKTNRRGGCAVLVFRNTFATPPVLQGGMPVSTKQDRENHGFGLKSIRLVACKYGGTVRCEAGAQEFMLTLVLPVPENAETAP